MAEPRVLWVTGAGSGMGRVAGVAVAAGRRVAMSGRPTEPCTRPLHRSSKRAVRRWSCRSTPATLQRMRRSARTGRGAGRRAEHTAADVGVSVDGRARGSDRHQPERCAVNSRCRAAGSAARGGGILIISSYSGRRFTPYAGIAYSASKSALAALCQTLNAQEATHGVWACHLCPGDVDSDFLRLRPVAPGAEARTAMLSPGEVDRAVHFILESPSHLRIDELVISPLSQV